MLVGTLLVSAFSAPVAFCDEEVKAEETTTTTTEAPATVEGTEAPAAESAEKAAH